jgi:C4-dicarboxylate-specific signal transduction histidine kinase
LARSPKRPKWIRGQIGVRLTHRLASLPAIPDCGSLSSRDDIVSGRLRWTHLDINDVVRDTIALVRRELVSHQVSLRTDFASALPTILADRVQLQQVIINLVMNGIEAMQAVTDRPRELVIRSRQDEKQQC